MSKFLDQAEYLNNQNYQLLPFKFDEIDPDRFILTNMSGEFHILEKQTLNDFIDKKLTSSSAEHNQLRSKHFLRYEGEKASLELLALKTRTKFESLSNFTSLHMFVVTLRCDHSCPYCQVSRQSEDKAKFDMTEETAEKALQVCFKSPSPAIKIEFQGGEPLLNFDLVEYVVHRAEEMNRQEGKDLQFVIATTLSLLNEEILEFCKAHNIHLSTSLDGPKDLHNVNRPRPGRDSHERFEQGLNRARDVLGVDKVSALMTTTSKSLDKPREIIDEYLRLGFDGIFLRAISPYGFAVKTKQFLAYDTEAWLDFYFEGLDYILELNKSGIEFTEFFAATILTKMLTSNDPGFVDLMNPAGIGIAGIVYNYDGDVYASDESRMLAEMHDETFKLGNLSTDSYETIMLSDTLLDNLEESFTLSAPMCSDCAFEPYCGSDPVFHHAMYGDPLGRKPESAFCKRNMEVFKFLINKMTSDEDAYKIFLKWARTC